MQHVHPNVDVGLVGVGQPQQEPGGVQMPLDLLELDAAFTEDGAPFIWDLGEGWSFPVLNRAFRLLMDE